MVFSQFEKGKCVWEIPTPSETENCKSETQHGNHL